MLSLCISRQESIFLNKFFDQVTLALLSTVTRANYMARRTPAPVFTSFMTPMYNHSNDCELNMSPTQVNTYLLWSHRYENVIKLTKSQKLFI